METAVHTTPARRRVVGSADRTKARFMAAAERLFALHGYDSATVRAISNRAGVNLGTLTHYWGSKRALFADLLNLRFGPLATEHARRLRALRIRADAGEALELRELLAALIEPTFTVGAQGGPSGGPAAPAEQRLFHRLHGRALIDPSAEIVKIMNRIFAEPIDLFYALLRRCCPHLGAEEFFWRTLCVIGAQVFALHTDRLERFVPHSVGSAASTAAPGLIVHFLAAGMQAPPLTEPARRTP
jgi:AcrR family transcriptional regulator